MMQRNQPVQTQKSSTRAFFVVTPFLFLIAGVLYNIISFASVGTVGSEMYAITLKTDQLHLQNQKLTETLAQKQSLRDSLAQAEQMGYVPVAKLTRVDVQDTKVALRVPVDPVHE